MTATPRILNIVCGPPGSGKTYHVNQHKRAADIVFDFDAIAHAMGAPLYECPEHWVKTIENVRETVLHHPGNAWVIYTDLPKAREAATRHGGHLKIIDTPAETCIERLRAENRPRLDARIQRIHAWWEQYRRLG